MQNEVVKRILYDEIAKIGRDRIQIEISSDIRASKAYLKKLLSPYLAANLEDNDGARGYLEPLIHFMLTVSLIPSDRKVSLNSTEVDIAIPSLRALKKDPQKCLVIQIAESENIERITGIRSVQPINENVWLISERPVSTVYRNYTIDGTPSITDIIIDANSFLDHQGIRGPRLLR